MTDDMDEYWRPMQDIHDQRDVLHAISEAAGSLSRGIEPEMVLDRLSDIESHVSGVIASTDDVASLVRLIAVVTELCEMAS